MNPLRLPTCGLARCLTLALTLTLTLTLGKCRCLLRLQMVGEETQACSPVSGLLGKQTESTLSIPVTSLVPAVSWVGPGLGARLLAVLSWFSRRFTLYMWALQLSLSFLLSVERNTCSVCRSAGWWASGGPPTPPVLMRLVSSGSHAAEVRGLSSSMTSSWRHCGPVNNVTFLFPFPYSKIESEEYEEALCLAQTYGLDTDLVYQRQWRKSAVNIASIQNYLVCLNVLVTWYNSNAWLFLEGGNARASYWSILCC